MHTLSKSLLNTDIVANKSHLYGAAKRKKRAREEECFSLEINIEDKLQYYNSSLYS